MWLSFLNQSVVAAQSFEPVADSNGLWSTVAHWLRNEALEQPVTLAIILLLIVGAGSVMTVAFRGRRLNWRSLGSGLINTLWAAPAVVALAFVTAAVSPHFRSVPAEGANHSDFPWTSGADWNVKTVAKWPAIIDWTPKTVLLNGRAGNGAAEMRIVLESDQFADVADARQALADQAAALVQADFRHYHGETAVPAVTAEVLKDHVVLKESIEPIQHELEESGRTFEMFKVRWLVELSDSTRKALEKDWQQSTSQTRFGLLAGVIGLWTVVFGVLATYFRLDLRTDGEYRKRLKLGTVSLIVAAALGFIQLMQTWLV